MAFAIKMKRKSDFQLNNQISFRIYNFHDQIICFTSNVCKSFEFHVISKQNYIISYTWQHQHALKKRDKKIVEQIAS